MRLTVKKLLKIFFLIFVFGFVLNKYFLHIDFKNSCYIYIKPSLEFSNASVKESLLTLRSAAPLDYESVCKNVKTINPNFGCGGFQGGCFYSKNNGDGSDDKYEIYVSTSNRSLAQTMAVIMHETCHALQDKAGKPLNEPECYAENDRILQKLVEY